MDRISSRYWRRYAFAVAGLFFIGLGVARGQSQFGSVVGIVSDPTGARVPGTTIHATNEATNLGFSTVVGSSGDYVIGGLIPGVYILTAQKTGFQDYRVTGVLVRAGEAARADVEMKLGTAVQTISVSASATPLTTESGTVTEGVPTRFLAFNGTILPPNQPVADILLPYLPGQTYIGGRAVSAFGSRSYDRKITLDGSVWGNSNANVGRMPRGTVDELEAPSLIADAEHQTASTTEMITSKGTNNIHGSLWSEFQNGALNQLPWYDPPHTPHPGFPVFGWGFTVGGPVYIPKLYNGKNKTFFDATFQRYYYNLGYQTVTTVPNDAMRQGNLAALGVPINNPATGLPGAAGSQTFTGGIITAPLSPISQNILKTFYPSIGSAAFASPDGTASSTILTPYYDVFARVDEQFGTRDSLSVTYLHNHTYSQNVPGATSGSTTGGPATTGFGYTNGHLNYFNASENHIFSPSILNEINFGARVGPYSGTSFSENGATLLNSLGLPTTPGAPTTVTGGPTITINGMSSLNWGAQSTSESWIYTFRDNVSWTRGRSTAKFGFEFLLPKSTSTAYTNVLGTYTFTGYFTGTPFGDFLLGLPYTVARALPPGPLSPSQHQLGFYATDAFRITRKLTFIYGLRVEQLTPPTEAAGKEYNFDVTTGHVVVPNQNSLGLLNPGLSPAILSSIVTASAAGFPSGLINPLWSINPRIGLAYQLGSDTVVRAGFGSYGTLLGYGAPTGGVFTPGTQNATNSLSCSAGVCTPGFTLANPFASSGTKGVSGLSILGINPKLKSPVTYQWQLTLERRLPAQIMLRATYSGSESNHLPWRSNINVPQPSSNAISQSSLPFPNWSSITYANSGGNTSFNALDIAVKRRWANGLTFDIGYSLSKCLSDVDESGMIVYGGVGALGPVVEDPYNLARDKGNCEETARHLLRSTFVYDVPFGTHRQLLSNLHGVGGGVVNGILGGWTVSGMFLARTGHYFTPLWTGFDAANTGQTVIRPDRVCSGTIGTQTWDHIFTPSCFVQPASGRYGNAGTGIINGLGGWDLDGGIFKYFTLSNSERVPKLRISMTSINVLGHPAKETDDPAAFTINELATVARADDCIYTNGATANLGQWRHIYLEARFEW